MNEGVAGRDVQTRMGRNMRMHSAVLAQPLSSTRNAVFTTPKPDPVLNTATESHSHGQAAATQAELCNAGHTKLF